METNHSFVICAYGDSPYLEKCISSLKEQIVSSEILLYTSTPSVYIESLCETYNIPFYTSQGGGIGKDWNNALSFVKTPYATIAHQDDVYLPEYTKNILEKMKRDSLIVYSDYRELKNNIVIEPNTNLKIKNLMLKTLNSFASIQFWRNRVLSLGNPICCPAVTFNLNLLRDFSFNEEMKVSLDWFAWYQISKYKGRFEFVDIPLMYHRIHEESETTNSISNNIRSKEDLEMYKLFWPDFIARLLMKQYEKSQNSNG